jgi:hypothetical protein
MWRILFRKILAAIKSGFRCAFVVNTLGPELRISFVDLIEFLVAELFDIHHLVFGIVNCVNELVKLQVYCARVSILCVLNDEDHQERDDCRTCIDDKLPRVGVVKKRSCDCPDRDDDNRAYERPLGAEPARGGRSRLPESITLSLLATAVGHDLCDFQTAGVVDIGHRNCGREADRSPLALSGLCVDLLGSAGQCLVGILLLR